MHVPLPRSRNRLRRAAVHGIAVAIILPLSACGLFRSEQPAETVARSTQAADLPPLAAAALPGKHATRRGCYVFYHDFEIDRNDPIFTTLEELPDQVYGELRLPPSNSIIQVFLFDTQERYERYMFTPKTGRYRHLPSRRAYFITEPRIGGGADELKVFTWMGGHIHTDLRHELTHALLNAVLKGVPLWLDEGLAGYFELPPGTSGINSQHLDALRRGSFLPDLARLEKFDQVKQMEKPEYREAWAWVHFMLKGEPAARRVLLDYLQQLRTDAAPGQMWPRLREAVGNPEQALLNHLAFTEHPRPGNR